MQFKSSWQLEEHLLARGSKRLGNGAFGCVVEHPTDANKVLKIGGCVTDGWPLFAAFAAQNPSRFVPVIYSFEWVADESGERRFYVSEIERLAVTLSERARRYRVRREDIPLSGLAELVHEVVDTGQYSTGGGYIGRCREDIPLNGLAELVHEMVDTGQYSTGGGYIGRCRDLNLLAKKTERTDAEFAAFCRHAATFLRGRHDIHDGNWMLRENGDIVLTDPFADLGGAAIDSSSLRIGASPIKVVTAASELHEKRRRDADEALLRRLAA